MRYPHPMQNSDSICGSRHSSTVLAHRTTGPIARRVGKNFSAWERPGRTRALRPSEAACGGSARFLSQARLTSDCRAEACVSPGSSTACTCESACTSEFVRKSGSRAPQDATGAETRCLSGPHSNCPCRLLSLVCAVTVVSVDRTSARRQPESPRLLLLTPGEETYARHMAHFRPSLQIRG